MGRRHALYAAPFLIDQDRRVGAADAFVKRADQRAQLIAIVDIALEEDEAPRIVFAKEFALIRAERKASAAADEGLGHGPLPSGT